MNHSVVEMLEALHKSKFRSSFHLKVKDIQYIQEKEMETIQTHAYDFIRKRLAPKNPLKDGKQTPMRGHPVFIAQHATATCCRGCLEKWYHIPQNRELNEGEIDYVVTIIMEWIKREMVSHSSKVG